MRMVDIIVKKRDGKILTKEEISFFVKGYVDGTIPDYQVSSLAMAILFRGMNKEEITVLTDLMMHSGDIIDLSSIKGVKADKHSTGGVGDKTSLVLGPMVAACGVKIAKMSGRGLGHTGGTLDKMEAIPGMKIAISEDQFLHQVNEVGLAIVGQTGHLVPADKKLYSLRDVTGTVESIPLIASSVMSKKLASGSDTILLDVKFGSGAFMKDLESARELARTMVDIGDGLKRDTRAILTDMEQPLGLAVGNALEVKEAIDTLHGKGPRDLVELCLEAGAIMLEQAKVVSDTKIGRKMLEKAIVDGSAFNKLKEMVKAQGGDISYIEHPEKFPLSKHIIEIHSENEGYVRRIEALEIGESAMRLGAGRETYDDVIDMSSGIVLRKKVGDFVKKGDVLCIVHTNKDEFATILKDIHHAFKLSKEKLEPLPIVHDYIR
ncbi:MAG: pyrimidine-nucleoside phosphorylase [Erysipelotrichia bacterium]|jgi:pyrimidine-nucleoside phosphorylase|nr:pyrimidine-nucleoside phosphorylase [Erysipelotrichia bacterium]